MGMAASQARLIGLAARKSDLEYQGQQINQERTILSQQVTELYNTLLDLQVPTPPSTDEFTTIQYVGSIGATLMTIDSKCIKPSSDGTFNITVSVDDYGHNLEADINQAKIGKTQSIPAFDKIMPSSFEVNASNPTGYMNPIDSTTTPKAGTHYIKDSNTNTYKLATQEDLNNSSNTFYEYSTTLQDPNAEGVICNTIVKEEDIYKYWVLENGNAKKATTADFVENGGLYYLNPSVDYYEPGSSEQYPIPDAAKYKVNGCTAYSLDTAPISEEQKKNYIEAINNSGLKNTSLENYDADDFYIYFSDNKTNFVLKNDVDNNSDGWATTYNYIPNGEFKRSITYENCILTFDASNGRITGISMPILDQDGNNAGYRTMDVEAQEVTDSKAYEDAMASYQYAQYEYDKKQQDINAKTENIQRQDRTLELRLTRLDNSRKMIETEYDAVKKVCEKNIDISFKTFNG